MNAAFFGLAFLAALNPKLLAVDLLLIENRRPRIMFACLLAGGLGLAVAVGFLDVFVLHADAVKAQGSASAGLDLAIGVAWLAGRARQLISAAALIAGTYMVVTGLIRLS